jgi:hypothetical protein
MTDMVERVARTMQADYRKVMGGAPNIQTFRKWAKAAIAAMRDPTKKMIMARLEAQLHPTGFAPRIEWQAMIGAALECSTKPDGQ